jgi:hypothetical protein
MAVGIHGFAARFIRLRKMAVLQRDGKRFHLQAAGSAREAHRNNPEPI